MATVLFFCIPAHGHVNPTLPVVRELVRRGYRVRYYLTQEFRAKIEAAGAEFVDIEPYMPPAPEDIDRIAGRDFAALIGMVTDTTLAIEERIAADVALLHPDGVVADSVCFWGKLLARKYGIPYVCSTTTFAFNQHTAQLMKKGLGEIVRMVVGMPRIEEKIKRLRANGYDVPNLVSILQNDNDTDTVVYTSRLFQPMAETFSERYAFVGPSVECVYPRIRQKRPRIYVSLGTVLSNNPRFFRQCIEALTPVACDAVFSVGGKLDRSKLGEIPPHIKVYSSVNQLEVLAGADLFITHCGMNSVNESLLYGVPMVLCPQHSEEQAVASRVAQLGAGVELKRLSARAIRQAVQKVLAEGTYEQAAQRIAQDFAACGGAVQAADWIEKTINGKEIPD